MGVAITGPSGALPSSDYLQTETPITHPETGLAITTTGYHWYGQEPLALNKVEGVRFTANPNIY